METRNVYEIFVNQSERGNSFASWKLATMHTTGRGCERSSELATKFLEIAALQGSLLARRDLALNTLRGTHRSMSIARAYKELLEVLRAGITTGTVRALMESGNPKIEKATAKELVKATLGRNAFEPRFLLAVYNALGSGVSVTKSELYAHLRETVEGTDKEKSTSANRALWLSDIHSYFFMRSDLSDNVKALLTMPDDESKIDAFELSQRLGDSCPNEIVGAAQKALSLLALRGNTRAQVLSLCTSLHEAPESVRPQLMDQLQNILEKKPQYFNEHVASVFRRFQNEYHGFTEALLPFLLKFQNTKNYVARSSLASAFLALDEHEQASPIIAELISIGHCEHFQEFVDMHRTMLKNGKTDANTALFWAEAFQQDNPIEGLAAVQAVYEAMGAQSEEQKLIQYQVLEERAKQGDPEASTDLALLLLDSKGICISSKQRIFHLLETAAAKENARAMFHLGECFLKGIGTHADADMAHYWLTKASALGYTRTKKQIQKKKQTDSEESENSDENRESTSSEELFDNDKQLEQQVVSLDSFRSRTERKSNGVKPPAVIDKEGA